MIDEENPELPLLESAEVAVEVGLEVGLVAEPEELVVVADG